MQAAGDVDNHVALNQQADCVQIQPPLKRLAPAGKGLLQTDKTDDIVETLRRRALQATQPQINVTVHATNGCSKASQQQSQDSRPKEMVQRLEDAPRRPVQIETNGHPPKTDAQGQGRQDRGRAQTPRKSSKWDSREQRAPKTDEAQQRSQGRSIGSTGKNREVQRDQASQHKSKSHQDAKGRGKPSLRQEPIATAYEQTGRDRRKATEQLETPIQASGTIIPVIDPEAPSSSLAVVRTLTTDLNPTSNLVSFDYTIFSYPIYNPSFSNEKVQI